MNTDDIVIVAAARTPQGRLKGQLAPLTAVQLGSAAIKGAIEQGGVPADAVDAVLARSIHNAPLIIALLAARTARERGWATLGAPDEPWPDHPKRDA